MEGGLVACKLLCCAWQQCEKCLLLLLRSHLLLQDHSLFGAENFSFFELALCLAWICKCYRNRDSDDTHHHLMRLQRKMADNIVILQLRFSHAEVEVEGVVYSAPANLKERPSSAALCSSSVAHLLHSLLCDLPFVVCDKQPCDDVPSNGSNRQVDHSSLHVCTCS
jgi:hypothetical protein